MSWLVSFGVSPPPLRRLFLFADGALRFALRNVRSLADTVASLMCFSLLVPFKLSSRDAVRVWCGVGFSPQQRRCLFADGTLRRLLRDVRSLADTVSRLICFRLLVRFRLSSRGVVRGWCGVGAPPTETLVLFAGATLRCIPRNVRSLADGDFVGLLVSIDNDIPHHSCMAVSRVG